MMCKPRLRFVKPLEARQFSVVVRWLANNRLDLLQGFIGKSHNNDNCNTFLLQCYLFWRWQCYNELIIFFSLRNWWCFIMYVGKNYMFILVVCYIWYFFIICSDFCDVKLKQRFTNKREQNLQNHWVLWIVNPNILRPLMIWVSYLNCLLELFGPIPLKLNQNRIQRILYYISECIYIYITYKHVNRLSK